MNIVSCNFPAPAVWRQTLLYGTDPQGSVTAEAGLRTALPVYGAWGTRRPGGATGRTAFAGEVRENHDLYRLGNRLYSPRLRRFLSADPLSPFGAGGLNRYAYCGGDPVNRIDPTGNSWLDWLGAALGIVGAVVGTVVTGGALLGAAAVAATGSLAAAMSTASGLALTAGLALDVVSLAAEVGATVALATGDKKAMNILGWVAFGTGLASAGAAMVPRAGKAVARTGRFVGRWQHRLQHAGGRARRHGVVLMAPEAGKSALEQLPSVALEKIIKSIPGKDIDNLALTSKTMQRNINQLPLNINKIFDVDLVKNAQSMAVVNPGPHYHPSQHLDLDRAFLTAVSGYNGELSGVSRHRFRSAVAEAGLTIEDLQPISYMWMYDLSLNENVNMYIFWQNFKEGQHNLNRLRQIYRPDWRYWFLPEALP